MNVYEFMDAIEFLAIASDMYIGIVRAPLGCGMMIICRTREANKSTFLNTSMPSFSRLKNADFKPYYDKIEKEIKHLSTVSF